MKRLLALTFFAALLGALAWWGRDRATAVPPAHAEANVALDPQAPFENPTPPSAKCENCQTQLTPAPEAHAKPVLSPAQQAFRRLAKEGWDSIPLKSTLQARSSAQLHATPSEVMQAGERVGQIEEALAANPTLLPMGLRFSETVLATTTFRRQFARFASEASASSRLMSH